MNKTEGLRERINSVAKEWFEDNGLAYRTMPNDRTFEGDILQACKGAGLKFVPESMPVQAINSLLEATDDPIEEIDV